MRIHFNYTKEGFFQILPLYFIIGDEDVILLGFGRKNIAFVFRDNSKHKQGGEVKSKNEDGLKEFVFIWYKKMEVGNTTHYTAPFRTKIKAKNREEASKMCTDFALRKMSLCICEEKDYDSSSLGKLRKSFDDLNKEMDNIFNKKHFNV